VLNVAKPIALWELSDPDYPTCSYRSPPARSKTRAVDEPRPPSARRIHLIRASAYLFQNFWVAFMRRRFSVVT
jgi:hypothetical protein